MDRFDGSRKKIGHQSGKLEPILFKNGAYIAFFFGK